MCSKRQESEGSAYSVEELNLKGNCKPANLSRVRTVPVIFVTSLAVTIKAIGNWIGEKN